MSKKNTRAKRIFAFMMAVLIAVTYMPTSLFAYAEDYVTDGQVTDEQVTEVETGEQTSEDVVEETAQEETTADNAGRVEPEATYSDATKLPAETAEENPDAVTAEEPDATVSDGSDNAGTDGEALLPTDADQIADMDDLTSSLAQDAEDTESDDPATTETDTEADTEAESRGGDRYPARIFKDEANGVKVVVSAPEGALPENARMVVKAVEAKDVEDAVAEKVGEDVNFKAVDITFVAADGTEIEPLVPVSVSLRVPEMDKASDKEIIHIDDEGEATLVEHRDVAFTGASLFDSDQFSVYVVVESEVPRLTVNFVKADGTTESMIIKAADEAPEVDKIIYDPGAGSLEPNEVFKGWTTDQNYTAGSTMLTIAEVRSAAMTQVAGITSDTSVTYYAAVFTQYKVTYEANIDIDDPESELVTVGTEVVETPKYNTSGAPYSINMNYSTDDSHNFEGWLVVDGLNSIVSPTDITATTLLPNGTALTITGDIKLSVSAPQGHWLIFDENGKGATYNAPRFIESGETTSSEGLLEMVRNGYTFGGWYKDAECTAGQEFTFGRTIDSTTIIYAKWNAVTKANYTVLIWKQNVAGDGYDFEESVTVENANVNSTPNVVNATTGAVQGADYSGETGFHFKSTDQASKTVVPEGNTVVNVYWDRNEVTFNFYIYGYGYTADNSGYYGLVNGVYVDLPSRTNPTSYLAYANGSPVPAGTTVYYRQGQSWSSTSSYYANTNRTYYASQDYSTALTWTTYNSQHYSQNYNQSWTLYTTMTGLYGSTLADNNYTWPTTYDWYENGGNNGSTSGSRTTFLDAFMIPSGANTENFYGRTVQTGNSFVEFYKQKADGSGYELANSISSYYDPYVSTGVSFSISDKYNGFVADHYTVGDGETIQLGEKDGNGFYATGVDYTNTTLRIYFNRLSYKLLFYDGAYYDGNNNRITDESSQNKLREVDDVTYGASLTSYNKDGANYYVPTAPAGYVFEGWYIDDACTSPYVFTTMPEGGLTVYAKWRQIQFRVFLHPNAGDSATSPTLSWGSETQQMNFRISYDGQISVPTGTRNGYEFYGWYTDQACSHAFSQATHIRSGSDYNKATDFTEGMDKWGNGATSNGDLDRFWITQKYELWAKWSAITVGANGIGVVYDDAEGTNAPSDTALYKDNTSVSAGAAPTPPTGKLFDHWVLQTWNGTAYVDTETTVLAGQTFTILKSDAKITDASTGVVVDPAAVVNTGSYNYTVQLKAVYKDKEEKTPTHIAWYSNYGTENDGKGTLYRYDKKDAQGNDILKINEAVDILGAQTREGYTFKGWTKTQGGTSADFLVWDGSKYTATVNGETVTATQVAADEKKPYEDLYAVWEPIHYIVRFDKNADDATEEMADQSFTYDVAQALTANAFQRPHYTFTGWNTAADGSGKGYENAEVVKNLTATDGEVITLYAQWTINNYPYTIHHYLKGTTTQVANDVTGEETYGLTVTAEPADNPTYQGLTASVDSYDPSQTITIEATETGNVITVYYTLPLTITAKTDSKTYDGEPLTGGYTITGATAADEIAINASLAANCAAPSITNVSESTTYFGTEDQAKVSIPAYYVPTFVSGTLTITPKAVTVTAKSENFTYDGNAHSNSGYDVSGLVGDDAISAVVTGSITFPSESPVTNEVTSYSFTTGTASNYTVATVNGQLTMTKATVAITITAASQEWTYDGSAHSNNTVTVTSGELLTGDELVATATGSVTNVSDTATGNNPIAAGYKIMHGENDVTENYVITTQAGTLTINPKAVTVTAKSEEFTYDGNAHSNAGYDVEGLVGSDAISAVVTGSITFPKESPVTNKVESYEFTTGTAGNYTVTPVNGELTMTTASVAITITAASQEWTYDGSAHSNNTVTVTSGTLLTGDELVATATGSVTNVSDTATGNNPIAAGYKIMHGNEDVTANYVISTQAGTLTINPKAVTVTAQDKAFTYTGSAQSWPEYDVVGLVGDDEISAVVTGSITFPAQSPVVNKLASYEFTKGTPGNYTVTTADGELTMTNAEVAITITAASQEWTYDGSAHSNSSVTVTSGELLAGDELVAEATGSVTNVSDTATGNNPIAAGYKIMHGEQDVTANYAITTVDGTLTINPKAVTVTAKSEEFTYDGNAHSNAGYDVDGLVGNDAISAVVTGSITFPSQSPVTNVLTSYEFTTGTAGNYDVTTANGQLTMTTANVAITITAASQGWTYDGSAHSNNTVTVTSGTLLTGDELVAEATGSVTNVADTAEGNNPIKAGYKIMHGTEDVTANYTITTEAGTLTINPKAVTVTAQDKAFTYTGAAQSWPEYDVDGLVGNDAISAEVTGSITFPSESPVANVLSSYTFTSGTPGNYTVTKVNGELTMTNASVAITITAADDEWTYDGSAHQNTEVTVTSGTLLTGDELVAEATGSVTNVADSSEGNNPIKAGYKIMHGDEDVTANYVITTEAGTLTINPKAVTVTAKSEEFTYDGTAHSNAGYDVDGLVGNDAISAVVTGSITFPTESPVTNKVESYEFTTGTPGNYDVTTVNGQLTMTKAEVAITIKAADDSKTYDGTALTNSAVTVTSGELLAGDELVATATGSATNVADTSTGNNPIAEGYKIMHGDKDVTANYVITTQAGTLTIKPKAVTVTAKSENFTYDGTAHSNDGYDVTGLVGEDAISAVVTGSITFPSESPVTNELTSYEFTTGTPGNYTVTTANGQLTMTAASVAITIKAADDGWTYDGNAHQNTEVTVTSGSLLTGDRLVAEATGSVTNVADTSAGNNPIKAGYKIMHGDEDVTANYVITTQAGTLTINPKAVTVTAKSEEFTYDGTAHSNAGYDVVGLVGSDKISAVVTGSITFPSESPVANVLSSYTFTTGTPGNYTVTTADGQLTMTTASVAITIKAADDEWTYDGSAHQNTDVTVTSGSLLAGDTLVATATGSVTNVADTAEGNNPIAEGYKIMHGTQDVTANYVITTEDGTLTINPKAVTVTAQDKAFAYTGEAQSWPEYDVDGLVGSDAISAVVTGSITFPSESPVTNVLSSYTFTSGTPGNYTVTTANGQLTMTNAEVEITIKAADDSKTYDGTALTNSTVTVAEGELLPGDVLVAEATGSATNVADTSTGNNPIAAGYKIMHGDEDVTANYAITTQAGTLTIDPKAVTVTAKSEEFTYDGTAHSNNGYDVTGLVGSDAISAVVTGSITFPSESPVVNELTSYEFTTGTPGNYTVTTADGELTMTNASVAITIKAADDSKTYDGTALTNSTVTVTSGELLAGDTLVATATGSATNVADTADGNNPIAEGYKIMHGTEDVTANYVITPVDGKLTIKPKAVTVTAQDKTFAYTGEAQSWPEYDVDGLVGSDAISAVVTGSITFPSESPVVNELTSYEFTAGTPGNYTVTTANGELTMTTVSVAITIKAADDSKTYDGTALTNSTVTVTEGELLTGDELVATATGSATNVADTAEGNNPIAAGYKIMHGDEEVTANYVITTQAGTLTIDPKAVTVTAKSEEFTYDGTAHSNDGYDVVGLVGDDAISAVVTGSITFPSESPVTNELTSYSFTTGTPGNYTVTTADGELTMTTASVAITITAASDEWTYDGNAHQNTEVTVTSGTLLTGDELVAEATGSVTNVADTAEGNNPIAEGYKIMHGDEDVTDNYVIATETGTLTIKPKAVTVTAQDKEFAYTGAAQSWPEYDVEGLVGNDAISAVVTGSITLPSESPVVNELTSYEFTAGTPGNYTVTTANGQLTMTNASVAITIKAADDSKTYDGTALTNAEVTVTEGELLTGDELVATATGSATNVADTAEGNNPIAEGYKIMHGTEDVTANYVITTEAGTLTIEPKAVTVTAKSEEFTYDGTAHSNDGYDVTGLVGDDAISAVVTGSITFPSESPVTNELTSYEFTAGTPGNYTVTTYDGELTMTTASVAITIKAADDSKTYDGTALNNAEVTVTEGTLLTGDELVATATGSATNVADTADGNNPIAEGYKIMHGTEDVTANYVITTQAGTLTIEPKAVTVTAQDKTFAYTGEAQSWPEYDVDGLVGNDAISAVVTGSITFPSESPVVNELTSYEFTAGTPGNYTVTTYDGELTMTNAEVAITIKAADDSKTYDGSALTNSTVTVTEGELLPGDELVATATGSATNVADTATGNNPIAEGYKIMHGTEDVTDNYAITTRTGTLTIEPKAVTVTAQDKEFTYTGEAQSWPEYDVDGLVGNDAISAVVTGSITFPSESPVVNELTSYEFTTGTPGNYTVTTADGELTMTTASVEITIKAADDSKTYDGTALTNAEVTVTEGELLPGDTLVATATGSATNVADTEEGNNPIAEGYKIMHGTEDVTANYVITTEAGTLTIEPKAVTVTAKSEEFTYDGNAHSNNGYDVVGLVGDDAISAVVTGSITFPSESPVVNELTSYEFTAGTPGNYTVTTYDGELTMTTASVAITITAASDEWTYDGSAHQNTAVTVTEGELLTGDELVAEATGSVTNVADTEEGNNPIKAGYKVMHGDEDVTANYVITTEDGTLTIKPKAVTVTAQDKEFTYTGEAQSWPEYDVDGLVGDDAISAVVTGSITFPSESPVVNELTSYEFTTGTPGNYTVTTADGELTMTTASVEITIKAADDSKTYDGTALTNAEVTVTEGELLPGDTLVATATGSATNVADTEEGNNPIAEGYKIMHGTEDVTANYVITTEDGTLTIEPKAVTVTAKSEEFTYDGNAHSNNGYDVDGLVGNDAISAVVTGSITFPSESPVVNELTSYEFTAGTPGNYTVTTYDGELTMTTASVAITITAASDEWTYDGDAHQNTEVTVTSGTLLTGDELVAEATGSVTDVADTEEGNNPIKAGYKIMHGDEDVTANYVITTEDGTLTINPKEVTITAKDASKAYDGDPLTQPEFTASALETGDSHVFTVVMTDDSTITDVGTQPNVIATVDGVAVTTGTATAVGNYIVTTVDGELEITQDKTAIVITSATNEWTYDSKNHTDETYTVTYGGETVEAGALGKTFTLPNGDVLQIISTAAGVKNVSDNAAENNTYTFTVTRDGASTLGNYESITANVGTLTILPKAVTITADNANKAYDGTPLTQPNFAATDLEEGDEHVFEVVMTADSTITDVGTQPNVIATVDGVAVTTGKQTAVGNYLVTTADGQLTITKDEAEFVITSADHTWTYDSKNHTDETYTVTYKGTEVEAAADGKTFTLPNGDVLTITATAAGVTNVSDNAADNNTYTYVVKRGDVETTDNYKNVVTNIGDLVIEPKAVTITANDASKAYDGTALTEGGFTATALEEGDSHVFTVVMTADSTITDVGTQPNVIATVDGVAVTTGEQKAIGNYLVTTVNGTLEITQSEAEIVISSASNEWTYDGENHTDETYTVTYNGETVEPEEDGVTFILPNGDVITITPTAEGVTDVSDTAEDNNTFTYTVTRDGADTSANYNDLTTDPGTLAITPKLVKVTADDKTKVYGDADPELTATEEGVVEGDTLTYELYRDSGEDVGTYNISFNFPTEETDEADQPKGILGWLQRVFTPKTQTVTQGNYEIQFVDGEFEITPRPLTITAASDEKVYNGEPLTNPDYEITEGELLEGDSLESVTVTGSQTLVGSSANTPSDAKIVNAEGEDVTANYEVTYVDGTLTVTDDGVDPDDVVTKTHDGKTYQVGETIVFTISVTNIYDEEQTITIHEQEGVTLIAPKRDGVTIVDGNLVIEGVQPGETIEVKAEYTVTEEDALSGHFHNTVTVTFEGGNTYEDDDEVDHFAHMTVVKTVVNTPADGKVFRTGETIQYEITVTNDGTEVLTGITVTDELTGDEWTIEKLEVGETVTFKAEYTVTDKDAEAGSVTNVATAKGNDPDGDPETEGDEITTDTDFDKPKPPKTGDSNNLFGWTGMAGLAMAALAVLVATRKREEDAE